MRKKLWPFLLLLICSQAAMALEVTQITFEKAGLESPVVAPGNKLAAFYQRQNDKTTVYTKPFSPSSGTAGTTKKIYETYNRINRLQWLPQGTGLAFLETQSATSGSLVILDLNGNAEKLAGVELFAFDKQGAKLVYKKGRDLHIFERKTAASKKILSDDLFPITSLAWRGDGKITFTKKPFWGYPQLWSVDEHGKQAFLLNLTGHSQIAAHFWSSNDRRLVYKDAGPRLSSLWIMEQNGDNRLMLASGDVDLAGWYGNDAYFFSQKDRDERGQIWLAKFSAQPKPNPPPEEPRPLPLPNEEQILYGNNFDWEQNWGSYDGARSRVRHGVYEITLNKKNQGLKYLAPTTVPEGNFSLLLEFESRQQEGQAGIVFNLVTADEFNVLQIDPQNGTYALLQRERNRWLYLIRETKTSAVNPTGRNEILLRQSDRQLTIYLNGQYQTKIWLGAPDSDTQSGIWIASQNKIPVEFAFDNFQLLVPEGRALPSPERVLLFDDFSSKSGWAAGDFGQTNAGYKRGAYFIKVNERYSAYGYLAPVRIPGASYQVEVKADFQRAGEAGLLFNFSGWDNFCLFQINPTERSYRVFEFQSGRREVLAEGAGIDLTRGGNTLKVAVDDNSFAVYLNGRLLSKKNRSLSRSRQVGLMVGAEDQSPVKVYFDDFKVTTSSDTGSHWQPFSIQGLKNWSLLFDFRRESSAEPEPALPAPSNPVPEATPWRPAAQPASNKGRGLSFSLHLPFEGVLPLAASGGAKSIYAVFTDAEADEYSFSAEQSASAEAKPIFVLALDVPLNRKAFQLGLGFSLRGFTNPILVSNEVDAKAGGYLLNFAGSLNCTLPVSERFELFGGIGLDKYLLAAQNTLAAAGPTDPGYDTGDQVYPPGSTLDLSGWSASGFTAHLGLRLRLTPHFSLEGQYSYLPGCTISNFKYSLGGAYAEGLQAPVQPNPISIQGQSLLSMGVSANF
jgi:hypothetical protein